MIHLITASGKRFYANLLIKMQREFTPPNFPFIAGVGFKGTKLRLVINPHKFSELSLEKQVFVLEHECLHVIYEHLFKEENDIPEQEGISKSQMAKLLNIAQDLVINQTPGLEEIANTFLGEDGKVQLMTPLSFEQHFQINIPRHATSREYLALLLREMKDPESKFKQYMDNMEQSEGGGGPGFADDHGEFGKQDGVPEGVKKQIVANAIKDAQNQAGMGNTPGFINEMISNMFKAKVDWRKELWAFMTNSTEVIREQSRSKRNRRYGILYPGHVQNPKVTIAFIMDTSGSMSDTQLAQGWAEMVKIYQTFNQYDIYFIQADAEVKDATRFDQATQPTIMGRGGTAYQPAIDKAVELNADMIVYYGDMDCADTPNNPNIPTFWAVTGNQKPPVEWGKYVRVE